MARKLQHCLFIEEERYNWAPPRSVMNRRLIVMSLLIVSAGLLFGLLR